ncbi:SPFH domain / Band 7 family protein [Symmachiella dynata]|uniref:SPFH domain / Band 7 family protein n=2 Tax=Symmachiella dynata TaxID=2527995 RepID=A0A517ZWL8_9PLAN|nr:SPFH domain-containing protein [Symmachiella dynata]QDT51160.1 SPFH domain / Band 7 family protein [Symmachiella dynata]QDU46836.1 SPFH domain / Band 7 family protein [Symmachiella dynata]
MHEERKVRPLTGWIPLVICLALVVAAPVLIGVGANKEELQPVLIGVGAGLCGFISLFGCMPVAPNEARVLLLFGIYKGSVVTSGFYWVNPFLSKKKVSLRVHNFETGSTTTPEIKNEQGRVTQKKSRSAGSPSKVNDRDGNPIDISAIVVWKVVNTAEAMFEVDDYEDFVAIQSEAALRNLASRHPYDSEDHEISLRGSTTEISDQLRHDIQERLDKAGVHVIEARISQLAYAPEIAAAMLQRQQAQAVVAARTKIVEGAVGMVQMALEHLAKDKIVELDDERRAAMVSNLLVVLCSDRHTQPVVNTGSLYH